MMTQAAPDSELARLVTAVYEEQLGNNSGELADYIPELTKVPPDSFGVAVVSHRGELSSAGDVEVPFTIQSVSKPLTLALLIDLIGRENIGKSVGVQPSGDPFNAIELDPKTHRPFNPMVNAGAIAVSGRLLEVLGPDAFDRILHTFSAAAGRSLDVDMDVFHSERDTGHRNRAIGHLLRAAEVYQADVDAVLDIYFKQCSIRVTAVDIAMIGATFANIGANPITGRDVFGVDAVRETLSVMFTCGMYDATGQWACRVGLPAKSGVGGGVMAVVNRQLGIGVFSPRLDSTGNSVRGQLCCATLSDGLGLHAFDSINAGSSFLSAMSRSERGVA